MGISENAVKNGQELKKHALIEGNIAPVLEQSMAVFPTHHLQLTRQVKAQLSLLEDMFQRKQFLLREVQGIVKRAN